MAWSGAFESASSTLPVVAWGTFSSSCSRFGARAEDVNHRAGVPAQRPVVRACRRGISASVASPASVSLAPHRPRRGIRRSRRTLHDRLSVAAGRPHRVSPPERDMLVLSFGGEDAPRLVRLPQVDLVSPRYTQTWPSSSSAAHSTAHGAGLAAARACARRAPGWQSQASHPVLGPAKATGRKRGPGPCSRPRLRPGTASPSAIAGRRRNLNMGYAHRLRPADVWPPTSGRGMSGWPTWPRWTTVSVLPVCQIASALFCRHEYAGVVRSRPPCGCRGPSGTRP
jgi:hypothetical protein